MADKILTHALFEVEVSLLYVGFVVSPPMYSTVIHRLN